MKVGMMQPYFFPYAGYFSLIKHTDIFILLDEVQFIRHGWVERNRVLKQTGGWLYIKVPLIKVNGSKTLIKDLLIDNSQPWKSRILSQLVVYKKKAPYYFQVIDLINNIFSYTGNSLGTLNLRVLEVICEYLDIDTNIDLFSEMNLSIEKPNYPDEWALNICRVFDNVSEYWNPMNGKCLFDPNKYIKNQIEIRFFKHNNPVYSQNREYFESDLSIIDLLMFNSRNDCNLLLNNYTLI